MTAWLGVSAEHRHTWDVEFPSLDGIGLRGTLTTPKHPELESTVASVCERSSTRKARAGERAET